MHNPLHQIRLRDMLLLEHVQTLGTLGLAAQALHVTQPAVTQMLKGLEQAFGLPLVERGRRGVSLTAAGQAALVRMRCARHEVEAAHAAAQAAHQPVLRVGATPIASLRVLPMAVARLRRQQPAVRLTLTETGVESLWRQLAEGALDALVGRLPGPHADMHRADGLRHLAVGSERMVLVGGALHPLAATPPAGRSRRQWLQALAGSDWVLPPADALAVINFNEWFAGAGLLPPAPAIVSGSFYASLNMVARTELLTVVPESAARGLLATLDLAVLRTPWSNPPVDIVFAARDSNWDTAAVAALRACFTAEAAAAPTRAARPAPSRPRARPPA
jgi:DNA-binding transcriptional LysR family regulator